MLASIIYNYGKFCDDFKSTLKLGAYVSTTIFFRNFLGTIYEHTLIIHCSVFIIIFMIFMPFYFSIMYSLIFLILLQNNIHYIGRWTIWLSGNI